MPNGLPQLETLMRNNVSDPENGIFLHPGDSRGYSDDELEHLKYRDFETRLFITGTQCAGDSAFLRIHHTDNAKHSSNFNYVRDYIKAFHVVKNWTCAKSVLTTLLTMCFQLDKSDYYSFAISIASGLSNNAKNTDFEASKSSRSSRTLVTPNSTATMDSKELEKINAILDMDGSINKVKFDLKVKEYGKGSESFMSDLSNENMRECEKEVDRTKFLKRGGTRRKSLSQQMLAANDGDHAIIRNKFCFLMEIVFKRLAIRKFLVEDERSNIYRLVHCKTKYSENKKPLVIALFAFILQISLTTYIVLEFFSWLWESDDGEASKDDEASKGFQLKMLPLAIFTSAHSLMVAVPNFREALVAYRIFGRIGV